MSDPSTDGTPGTGLNPAMVANALAWKDPDNWRGDEYVGPGQPPWGRGARCLAVRNGKRCKKPTIPGGTVCGTHGGAAPQVKKRANLRLLSLVDPAIALLAREMTTADKSADRQRAANSILDRAGVGRQVGDVSADVARSILLERHAAILARRAEAEAQILDAHVIEDDEEIEDAVYAPEAGLPPQDPGAAASGPDALAS